jgi:hypothetical protein
LTIQKDATQASADQRDAVRRFSYFRAMKEQNKPFLDPGLAYGGEAFTLRYAV